MTTSTGTTYNVCDSCAPAVAYGDLTGLAAADYDRVNSFIENAGLLAYVNDHTGPATWDCDACHANQHTAPRVFERVN